MFHYDGVKFDISVILCRRDCLCDSDRWAAVVGGIYRLLNRFGAGVVSRRLMLKHKDGVFSYAGEGILRGIEQDNMFSYSLRMKMCSRDGRLLESLATSFL